MLVFGYNHTDRSIVALTTVADEGSAFEYIADHEKTQEYTLYMMYELMGDEWTFHRACANKYSWKCEGISALKHCRMINDKYVFY